MDKKILISLSVIGAVAAIAVGGTIAYFSDVETSTGNTFTAGTLDLTVDSKATYNGVTAQYGNWSLTDLGQGHLFFNLGDVKPGDTGEDTVSLHINNNDACGFVGITRTGDADNTCTEPEGKAEMYGGVPACSSLGELDDSVIFTIWADVCATNVTPGDNIYQAGCDVPLTQGTLDAVENWGIGKLLGNSTNYYGISWVLPGGVGNEVQSDSFTADVEFSIQQFRNQYNDTDKLCPTGEIK